MNDGDTKKSLKFRLLKACEIDCRIATVTSKGLSLLLYKDARVDQNILDEVVGPMNWQRSHSRENANCIVSIWDDDKKQWISKEDTGTESYTEKEKGFASDSFKRACFNWGIGRELYTAPFIWIPAGQCFIQEKEDRGKRKYTSSDRFAVKEIGYDENRNINTLIIKNDSRGGAVVYNMRDPQSVKGQQNPKEKTGELKPEKVSPKHVQNLYNECGRTGVTWRQITSTYQVRELSDLTIDQYIDAMDKFSRYPDKDLQKKDVKNPPENYEEKEGLPWD